MLTAALALVALPGLSTSHATSVMEPLPVGAFQPISIPASPPDGPDGPIELDGRRASAAALDEVTPLIDPGDDVVGGPDGRDRLDQPDASRRSERKPPLYSLTGKATFYDAGYTAMRLPRGTIVVICGDGGCIERTITDWGPVSEERIVDLYRPDFFDICGCPWWSGVVDVTVHVY
ncbi:MAG: hypothetical protein ACLGIJ_13140 [Candidatus Limnocylindria bacterium]